MAEPDAVGRTLDAIGRVNAEFCRLAVALAAVLIAGMTAIVLTGVFFRYVLNDSIAWAEDASILAMIWVAFLVAPFGYRYGGHVSIELFVDMMPEPVMRIMRIVINILVLWILVRFFTEALGYVESGWRMRANAIPLPISWFRMIVPVSFAALMVIGLELILRDLMTLVRPGRNYDLPQVTPAVEPE